MIMFKLVFAVAQPNTPEILGDRTTSEPKKTDERDRIYVSSVVKIIQFQELSHSSSLIPACLRISLTKSREIS